MHIKATNYHLTVSYQYLTTWKRNVYQCQGNVLSNNSNLEYITIIKSHKISQYYLKINSISILPPSKISINSDPHSQDHLGSSLHRLLTLRLGVDSTERRSGEFFVTYVLLGFGLCSKEEEDDDEPSKRKSTLILL